jgi:hypothetical protein
VVAVAAPPVAVTPVNAGIEKNVWAQASGAAAVIDASLVNVTVKVPLAATVSGVVKVCDVPDVEVAKAQYTSLVVVEQPVWATLSAEEVNPPAYEVLIGKLTAVIVTG